MFLFIYLLKNVKDYLDLIILKHYLNLITLKYYLNKYLDHLKKEIFFTIPNNSSVS